MEKNKIVNRLTTELEINTTNAVKNLEDLEERLDRVIEKVEYANKEIQELSNEV